MNRRKLTVIALGGNALINTGERGTADEQKKNIDNTAEEIAKLAIDDNYQIVITHGNGPQVGNILIQQQAGKDQVPDLPMYLCGAMSQGQIGFLLQNSLTNIFKKEKSAKQVATVITQVEVDGKSPLFENPSKPVGPYYSQSQAQKIAKNSNYIFKEDAGRGWRRVVASPEPVGIVELYSIKDLIEKDIIVICCGGGGIPVYRKGQVLLGIDAVIDKDHASSFLADKIDADLMIILTAVEAAYMNFGKLNQKKLDKINLNQAKQYLSEGHFASGSMKPKIEAAINFIEKGKNRKVVITSNDKLTEAIEGKTGTEICY